MMLTLVGFISLTLAPARSAGIGVDGVRAVLFDLNLPSIHHQSVASVENGTGHWRGACRSGDPCFQLHRRIHRPDISLMDQARDVLGILMSVVRRRANRAVCSADVIPLLLGGLG